ncbi:uncharacterized protein LOC111709889 isoform X3 [Eurytemora carolleeae]|uniref:uncharacterized protein LOC111709889 isoform X3 n=1 Tax=Eurytemora carolleeae TaxID=1294199 RepID=UPI000C7717BE|nr:uncharacterized protein LOC111709889 isoform X3 [Eurytemora carolleeae]|eukprot:XP_023339593.1 uncharacterized protein LOC111709889 isoform X3 [Eurytemora affinis]
MKPCTQRFIIFLLILQTNLSIQNQIQQILESINGKGHFLESTMDKLLETRKTLDADMGTAERSAVRIGLCNSDSCDCFSGVLFCTCSLSKPVLQLSSQIFGNFLPSIDTIQLSDCKEVVVEYIPQFTEQLRRIIILNTTSVKLNQGSLSFSGSGERLVFLGRISALYLAPGSLGKGITDLYIVSTGIPKVEEKTFSDLSDLEVLDLENVVFPLFNERLFNKTFHNVFPQTSTLKLLRVVNSHLGIIYGTFIKCFAETIIIENTRMSLESDNAFDLEGVFVSLIGNQIVGKVRESLKVVTRTSLLLQNNIIEDNYINTISLIFPQEEIERVVIRESRLTQGTSNYINLNSSYLEISDSVLHLVDANMIRAVVNVFKFRDNVIKSFETDTLNLSARKTIEISNNFFEHIQPGSLNNLKLLPQTNMVNPAFTLANNTFESMEDGFMKLDISVLMNLNSTMSDLYFNTDCSCTLVSDAVHSKILSLESSMPRRRSKKYSSVDVKEALDRLKKLLEPAILCNDPDGGIVNLEMSGICKPDYLAIIIGVVFAILSVVVLGWGLVCVNDKLKERALKQFIIPLSPSKEGEFELQTAESFKCSLPDLIRSMTLDREQSEYDLQSLDD